MKDLSSKNVIFVAAGQAHTGCITEEGHMYTWGEGENGVLGHGDEHNWESPKIVNAMIGKKPNQIAFGDSHTAICTADGKVYCFGNGDNGQLGHGDMEDVLTPKQVVALEDTLISQVACGLHFTMALTSDGQLYTWGNGEDGCLGHGSEASYMSPVLVERFDGKRVVQISCCNRHSFAIVSERTKHETRKQNDVHDTKSEMFDQDVYDFYS